MTAGARLYDCEACPAYCCSYAHIPVTEADAERLGSRFGLEPDAARQRFFKRGDADSPLVLRHKADEHYGTICRFLDTETRGCTVYEDRPAICREFPSQNHCGYWDFLVFEREVQDDPDWVAVTR